MPQQGLFTRTFWYWGSCPWVGLCQLDFWQFLLSKLCNETFLAGQAVHRAAKNLFLHCCQLVFVGVFFPALWGCEGFTASICQMWVFRVILESGKEKWLKKLTSYGRKWLKPPQVWAVCRFWAFPYESAPLSFDIKLYKSPTKIPDFPSAGKGRTLITWNCLCSTEAQHLPPA